MELTSLKAPPDAVAVKFTITPKPGGWDLDISPKDPVKIHYKAPNKPHDPNKKVQVAWVAVGLPDAHRIYITAKPTAYFGYMARECFGPIEKSGTWLHSQGPVRGPAKSVQYVTWTYNVMLTDPDGKVVASYDPGVDIGNDP